MRLCVQWEMMTRDARAFAEGKRGWLVLHERCEACGWEQVCVAPMGVPLKGLECSRCHELACRAKVVQ